MPTLERGRLIYHGTRWHDPQEKWWRRANNFPDRIGEDGGISYSLDLESSSKIRRAQVVITYRVTQDLDYVECRNKGEFFDKLKEGHNAVWTEAENELVIKVNQQVRYLEFLRDDLDDDSVDLTCGIGCAVM